VPLPKLPSFGRGPAALVPFLAILGGVGALALIMAGQSQIKRLQQQMAMTRQQMVQLEAENQDLGQRLQSLQGERKEVDKRMTALKDQLTAASGELERSKITLAEFEERYSRLSQERTQLAQQVATLTNEREATAQKVKDLEVGNEDLRRSAGRLRERFALLDRDYRLLADKLGTLERSQQGSVMAVSPSAASAVSAASVLRSVGETPPAMTSPGGVVELPPIVVRKDQAGMSAPVRGRVIDVSDSHNFVVVDKGSVDGVRLGMTLDILRGSATVGRVSVIRARPNMSACDIVRSGTTSPLQVGDLAVQSSP